MPEVDLSAIEFEFTGELVHWRGPSPFHFVRVPDETAEDITDLSNLVTYGWGCIPVTCESGTTTWTTSLFPREGGYMVPVKDKVRRAEGLELGAQVAVRMQFRQ